MATSYTTTVAETGSFDRRHPVRDAAKVERLVASIRANGWDGPPIVINSVTSECYTGVHRLAALAQLEAEGLLVSFPVLDIEADFRGDEYRDSDELAVAVRETDQEAADLIAADCGIDLPAARARAIAEEVADATDAELLRLAWRGDSADVREAARVRLVGRGINPETGEDAFAGLAP